MLVWCDLILPDDCSIPESDRNIIGISKDFSCRWSYLDGNFSEQRSSEHGVAGLFVFNDKSDLDGAPSDGEFVRWLQSIGMRFEELPLIGTKEYGLYSEWSKLPRMRCRPFNRIDVEGDRIFKYGIDEQGKKLGVREVNWYKKIQGTRFKNIPRIYGFEPLSMEFIDGKNIYEYSFIPDERKKIILREIVDCLKDVHRLGSIEADRASFYDAYIGKTFDRLKKVRGLVPFADAPTVKINGKRCRNIFWHRDEVERLVMQYMPKEFRLIHGDCTFSNMMLRHDTEPVLIDPRGYFGSTEFYGDAAYDWVKLYYSLWSNYDQFNLKRFTLEIDDDEVRLEIASNNWEAMEDEFFRLLEGEVTRRQMKLLLAIIWLSLTTYAWEDYDSICGAFYYGLSILEDALGMENLIADCRSTLEDGNKIAVGGLDKKISSCEKLVETLFSLGLDVNFVHVGSEVQSEAGTIRAGDLVIILSKRLEAIEND